MRKQAKEGLFEGLCLYVEEILGFCFPWRVNFINVKSAALFYVMEKIPFCEALSPALLPAASLQNTVAEMLVGGRRGLKICPFDI